MAGISQKVSPDEVLPLLARNVELRGYSGFPDRAGHPTEFLILLEQYVKQARELQALAGPEQVIRIENCAQAQPLLVVLGYRFRQTCGEHTTLETADPKRAFLTIDSGFPLSELEDKLQSGKPFSYAYHSAEVPVLFTQSDWTATGRSETDGLPVDVVESILHNRSLARLYSALARLDAETAVSLRQSPGLQKLLPLAPALDFYGTNICIRSGRVLVPGGMAAEAGWKDLVGEAPDSSGEFVLKLLAKDEGWLSAYFDTLSRAGPAQQAYFTETHRFQRFYQALRGKDANPSPTRPVFRPNPGLLLLANRLQFETNGEPHIPGNLATWQAIFQNKSDSRLITEWGKRAPHWNGPDQLMEGFVAISRAQEGTGPLQIYLVLSEMDRDRSAEQRLTPETVHLLADNFARFSDQYLIFSEFPALNNESITRYVNVAKNLDHISNEALRANAVGIFQAEVGLWQILARQSQIADLNGSWQGFIQPFAITSPNQLLDAGQASLQIMWRAAAGRPNLSEDEVVELLAGPLQSSPEGQRVRQEMAARIRSVLSGQRLASLDALLTLGDGLNQMAQGKAVGDSLLPLASELHEFELPRSMFTSGERSEWAPGAPINRHTGLQARTDFAKVISSASSPKELLEARGRLTSFLRDTLVGLNYAYYEPPGAQMLHSNPLFVRSHDFTGQMTEGGGQTWQVPYVFGTGLPAAGGAHLAGSLADLPFVLARVEQDFIVPENVQALIWEELVPSLLSSAVLPRWWGISREEFHAVALYQRAGEELLEKAATNEKLRQSALDILSNRLAPERLGRLEKALAMGNQKDVLADVMPADTFFLTAEYRQMFPGQNDVWGAAGHELQDLSQSHPAEVSWERLSKDFGAPHPALTQNYARELLNVKPFPALMGYGSRLLAESWDSNNLYWARLAEEKGYAPEMLNRLVPELTRRMVEKIFATDFEDWPAISRAMHEAGDEFRQGKIAQERQNALNYVP